MRIDGHYDAQADIAWLRFENFNAETVVAEEVDHGLREVDVSTGAVVALEYWHASRNLPADFLAMLAPPVVGAAA